MTPAVDDPHRLLAALTARWTPPGSLVRDLPADALLAWVDGAAERGDDDAVRAAWPPLLALAVADRLAPFEPWEVLARLEAGGWHRWARADRDRVVAVLDGWWRATLLGHPSHPGAHDVLVAQAALRGEVRPLLDRWLDELDGPGAVHLAELARDDIDPETRRLRHPGWDGREDLATQVVAWARSEPVLLGLTLVGGSHLEPGLLPAALDRLV